MNTLLITETGAAPVVPTPPLPYWPEPPSNEDIFSESLCIENNSPRAMDLLDQLLRLTRLLRRVNAHYQQVVAWTELCHAESECHMAIHNGQDWLDYVRRIKNYLNEHVTKKSRRIEEAIVDTISELSRMRNALTGRVEQLEDEHDQVQNRLRRLNSE